MGYFGIVLLIFGNSFMVFAGVFDLLPLPVDETLVKLKSPIVGTTATPGELSRKKCLEYYPDNFVGVAGGEPSLPKEFPHMAAIGYGNDEEIRWLCGGSLISEKFVLTAAHCVNSREGAPKFVRLGDLDLFDENDDAVPQNFTITRIIPHPSYKRPSKYHDIALLELDREADLNLYVAPACLNVEKEPSQTSLTATGWGKTAYTSDSSSFLMKVDLDHVPHSKCQQRFGRYSKNDLPNGIMENLQICAGDMKGRDTCQGDSGGPLQIKNEERSRLMNVHNIVGVTSFGKACALSGSPGIYARVSHYVPWIESVVWENESAN